MHSFELRKKLSRNRREDHNVILEKRGLFSSITHIIIFNSVFTIFNSKNYEAQDMSGFHLQNID